MTDNRKSDPSESTLLAQLSEIGHSWLNDVTDRDIALGALPPDYEAQLLAIRNLLLSHRDAEEAELIRLREIEELGESQSSQRLADDWVDQLHGMVYQDAAHSMAAIGLLAPFIESLFVHFFDTSRPTRRESSVRLALTNDGTSPPRITGIVAMFGERDVGNGM